MVILAGEIGGESKLALFTHKFVKEQKKPVIDSLISTKSFVSKDYEDNIGNIIEEFLNEEYYGKEDRYGEGIEQKILGGCFGIAAPVQGKKGHKKATIYRPDLSLNITCTEQDFRRRLANKNLPVAFINDMEAIGYSLFLGKGEDNLEILYQGRKEPDSKECKTIMLVSGGLGQAQWYFNEQKKALYPHNSEAGHSLFAPRTEEEYALGLFLLNKRSLEDGINHVSYEYVLSKSGFIRIYDFLKTTGKYGEESEELKQLLAQDQTNPTPILDRAINNSDSLSIATLNMFMSIYGAKTGDLALTYEAKGGIYIGGIPIPIDKLKEGIFLEAFLDKEGGFRNYNEDISIKVFSEEDIVLWGAVRHAINSDFVPSGIFAYKREKRQKGE